MGHEVKVAVDGTLSGLSISSPWWLHDLQAGVGWFMLFGGAVLLALRLAISVKELFKPNSKDDDGE